MYPSFSLLRNPSANCGLPDHWSLWIKNCSEVSSNALIRVRESSLAIRGQDFCVAAVRFNLLYSLPDRPVRHSRRMGLFFRGRQYVCWKPDIASCFFESWNCLVYLKVVFSRLALVAGFQRMVAARTKTLACNWEMHNRERMEVVTSTVSEKIYPKVNDLHGIHRSQNWSKQRR
jgi:hypothetical protein